MRMLKDKILLKQEKADDVSKGGIIIPQSVHRESLLAQVISIGPDVEDVNVGERVIFEKQSGISVNVDNEDYVIVSEEDVTAIYE